MAKVIPFRGVRYNPEKVKALEAVVTPPYDVIDPQAQKKYYEKHPYNIIRLELGYQYPTDNENDNRYVRAAQHYQNWLNNEILIHEKSEAIYLYEQEFSVAGSTYHRTGFFARVQLEDYAKGKILPHEETLARPKADRLALMAACQANFSPVFALYNDPGRIFESDFEKIKKNALPDAQLIDEVNEKHRLWVVTDPEMHKKITDFLDNKTLFIADGHHRYETALTFYRKSGYRLPGAKYILMFLINAYDQGLVILPTHRIVNNLKDLNLTLLKEKLKENFALEQVNLPVKEAINLLREKEQQNKTVFIMGTQEPALYLLTLKNSSIMRSLNPDKSPAWCNLDVAVLHTLILEKLLGINADKLSQQENLTYTRDEKEAFDSLISGQGQLVFLLNPTKIEQLTAVAEAGDKMPQKSTYFYPKIITGLIMNDLTI